MEVTHPATPMRPSPLLPLLPSGPGGVHSMSPLGDQAGHHRAAYATGKLGGKTGNCAVFGAWVAVLPTLISPAMFSMQVETRLGRETTGADRITQNRLRRFCALAGAGRNCVSLACSRNRLMRLLGSNRRASPNLSSTPFKQETRREAGFLFIWRT